MKAVIKVGGKQFIVSKGQTVQVDKLSDQTELSLEPLLLFDEKTVKIGTPVVKGAKVKAKVVEPIVAGEKLKIAKFQAKKRVKKITGHRQKYSKIEITDIST